MGERVIEFQPLVYSGCSILIPDFQILGAVVVCTVRPLHGSRQNGHATLYLFQKHLFFQEYNIPTIIHKRLQYRFSVPKPPLNYRTINLKLRENGWSCVLCTSLLINSPLHLRAKCDKVKYAETSKRQCFDALRSITYLEGAQFKRQLS